jgi:glyceraldehyde 3-phosphate dehydrogenase
MAKIRVGINGFGRIGRGVVRVLAKQPEAFDLVLINDLTDAKTLAHLLRYDSVHGPFPGTVEIDGSDLVINGDRTRIVAEPNPAKVGWGDAGADIVMECTGLFRDREGASKLLAGGAKKVLISAPAKQPDATLAVGINLETYQPDKHHIISNASCTTNCLAPVAKVLDESCGIVHGVMTTIHAYTNDQKILDLPHKDLRRARAAGVSMIPTTTGAAAAVKEVLPQLEGKLDGMAIRVPTPNVSVVDLVAHVSNPCTAEALNQKFRDAANGPLKGVLAVCDEPLVSIDFNGNSHSSIVDADNTKVLGNLVKVLAWYDNEMGYSHRMFDLARFVGDKL